MKKMFILTIVLSIIFSFNSCKKDNSVIENPQPDVAKISATVENNMLVFKTQEDYDNMLENWSNVPFESILEIEKEMGFHSMYAEYKQNNNLKNFPCDDPFLPLILSPDSKIKIGEYIFMLDFKNEKVLSMNSYNKTMQDFNFEDEVLPYLFDGIALQKNDYCDGRRESTTVGGKEGWVRYYNAGIYHSLYSEFDLDNYEGRMQTNENFKWKNRESNYYTYGNFNIFGTGNLYYSIYHKRFRLQEYTVWVKYSTLGTYGNVTNNCIK